MSASLEFPLAQGWSKGLQCVFASASASDQLNIDHFAHVEQVHGAEFYELSPADLRRTAPLARADALLARGDWIKESRVALLVKSADCAPLLMIDNQNQAIAAVHAGWRGLHLGIHKLFFERGYLDPKSTWVWLGPSLNGANFEVGEDMWSRFPEKSNPQIFAPHANPQKRYFYPWQLIQDDYKKLGVELLYNVEVDTYADPEFASYRRAGKLGEEKQSQKRNYSWIGFR